MLRVRNLIDKEKCLFSGIFQEQKLEGKKNKNYYMSIAIKNLIKQVNLEQWVDRKVIEEVILESLDDEMFSLSTEKKYDVNLFVEQIVRYAQWELKNNYSILQKNLDQVVAVKDVRIQVSADFIFEDNKGNVLVTKIHRKKPTITPRGRKNDTDPNKSIELYMLQRLGEQLYPNKNVIPRIVYLASKSDNDKTIKLAEFEEKKWYNVVDNQITETIDKSLIEERILSVANAGSGEADKCKESDCMFCDYKNLCNFEDAKNNLVVIPKVEKAKNVSFTYNQKKVLDFSRGICRVNSCAGSGKTTVLCQRIIVLIKEYCRRPEDFLVITYTEKGVREFKEKLIYLLDINGLDIDINRFAIHTFNSFGQELIESEFETLGYTEKPTLIDKIDRYAIISEILDTIEPIGGFNYKNPLLNMYNAKGVVVEIDELFEKFDNDNITSAEELELIYNYPIEYAEKIIALYIKFKYILKSRNLIQFSDQIKQSINLLVKPEMVEKYGFSDIVVDEFQDSNSENLYVVNKLMTFSEFKTLVVCGDESQTIFSWRGSKQENIINFDKMYSNVVDIFLKHNFRSTIQISNLANKLNRLNTAKIDKDIISLRDGKEPELANMDENAIADRIEQNIADGIPKNEISVIARTKAELLKINKILRERNIPTIIATQELLKDNCKVRNLINFTKFLNDTRLDLHFAEMLQVVKNKEFNEMKDNNLKNFVSTEKEKFLKTYNSLNDKEKLDLFYSILEDLKENDNAIKKLYDICKCRGIKNIKELSDYLNKFLLFESDIAVEQDDNIYDAVVLTTAHSSKGREFQIVYGMLDNFKYHSSNIEELDEERRVLFVLITRAKEELVLTYKSRFKSGFVQEIDDCMKGEKKNAV